MDARPRPVDAESSAQTIDRVVANVARVVHARGRDAAARRPLPRQRGPPDHRGLPGRRQDDARQGARPFARLQLLAHPVHTRPAADGHHGRQRLRPADERVRLPCGAGLREPAARGRGQPGVAEDAVRAARVHAGGAGDRGRRQLRAAAAVHGRGHAEPDRVRGDVSAARGAARPLRDAALARLSAAGGRGADAEPADVRPAAGFLEPVCSEATTSSP